MSRKEKVGLEKRKYVRVEVEMPVRFKIAGDDGGAVYRAATVNVSHGGACLRVESDGPEVLRRLGDHLPGLEVSIEIPGQAEDVNASSRTAWIGCRLDRTSPFAQDGGHVVVGLEFMDMSGADEDRITDIIADVLIKRRPAASDGSQGAG